MALAIEGVIGAPITPFTSDDRLDTDTLAILCERLVERGAHGVALPLHTGESLNLTMQERQLALEQAVSVVKGRVPVLAHVSMPGTAQAIELAQHAEQAGAAAVISVTPYHWRPSPRALVEHFRALARSVSIGVLAYNFPSRLGVSIGADVIEELIDSCPNFIGVKDASYDMQSFTEACGRSLARRPDFAMLTGVEYLLPSMPVGGVGCFSPAFSIAGELILELYDACKSGDLARARPLQYRASALWHLLRECGYPASVKTALRLQGLPVGGVRLPLLDLDEPTTRRLARGLEKLRLLPVPVVDI
ncbi:MAG TPA: dihydrodipicolinate synthase family protein [Jatrophihabitans sp.]|jgi:4-hydroxy-tetrahydrodipicolinate synthase